MTAAFDAMVLAGGRAKRLDGASKPAVKLHGRPLIDYALDAVASARTRIIVGPEGLVRGDIRAVLEDPPFGGPAAGIAAGLTALEAGNPAEVVVVLACDIPRSQHLVGRLLGALEAHREADGAQAVRPDGSAQPLAAAYRHASLSRAVDAAGSTHGLSVRELLGSLAVTGVDDPDLFSQDVDTWEDLSRMSHTPEVPS